MKRWHWRSLALLGGLLAVALIAVPRFTMGTSPHAAAQVSPSWQIDMDVTNGSGPCNPIDHTRNTVTGQTYTVAVCLVDADSPPAAFTLNIIYQDNLNQCQGSPAPNVVASDVAGTAVFSGPGLGSGWQCSGSGFALPDCDTNQSPGTGPGQAFLSCVSFTGPYTLPVGEGVAAPVAELTFQATGIGTDTLELKRSEAADETTFTFLNCTNLGEGDPLNIDPDQCVNGEDVKSAGAPTATPQAAATSTPTVAPTVTPACGLEGLPTCTPTPPARTSTPTITATATAAPAGGGGAPTSPPPPPPSSGAGGAVTPPNTGDGSNSASLNLTIAWIIAGAMLVTLAGGAFYLRRLRTRQ